MPKQLTLDMKGMETDKLPLRLLHKPTRDEQKRLTSELNRKTKACLQQCATPILSLMNKYRFTFDKSGATTEEPPIICKFRKSKMRVKEDWTHLVALFYDSHNCSIILKDLPKPMLDLWREVLHNHYVIKDDVEKIMGTQCFERSRWDYGYSHLNDQLSLFFSEAYHHAEPDESDYYRIVATYIYADSLPQAELFKTLFPDLASITKHDQLPDASKLKRYCDENIVFAKLPILASLYDSEQLPHTMSKQPVSVVKKAQKALALPDFFSTYPDSKQAPLSTSLLVNYYIFFREHMRRKKMPSEPEQLLKCFFEETFQTNPYNYFTLGVLLPYVKGIKKSKLESSNYRYVISHITSLLRDYNDKNWLSVDSLIMNLRTMDSQAEDHFMLISEYYIDDMNLRNGFIENKGESRYIHPGNMVHQLSEPFVKAVLFALSTLGIVETAYREPQAGDTSPYDGLQYVRVTNLGKYAMGLTDHYMPPCVDDQSPAFELDDQRLFIRVLNEKSPFVQLLSDYADSITPSLYSVSYESFLRNCSTRFDVERKVKMFCQYISASQPQIWQRFFTDVQKRCNPFGIPNDNYTLLTIPRDNVDLQRLVLSEPSVRRYVLKAENYMLLVKTSDMDNLTKAMKKLGYLM